MSTEPSGDNRLGSGAMQMKEVQFPLVTTREALGLRAEQVAPSVAEERYFLLEIVSDRNSLRGSP